MIFAGLVFLKLIFIRYARVFIGVGAGLDSELVKHHQLELVVNFRLSFLLVLLHLQYFLRQVFNQSRVLFAAFLTELLHLLKFSFEHSAELHNDLPRQHEEVRLLTGNGRAVPFKIGSILEEDVAVTKVAAFKVGNEWNIPLLSSHLIFLVQVFKDILVLRLIQLQEVVDVHEKFDLAVLNQVNFLSMVLLLVQNVTDQ